MKSTLTVEYFKRLNGIEKIGIPNNCLGKTIDTSVGQIFIPEQLDFKKQIYISEGCSCEYTLSNFAKFDYSLIEKGLLFSENSEGVFKISKFMNLAVFCDMNGCQNTLLDKLINCSGDFISISEIPYTFILHPFIANKEVAMDMSRFSICYLDEKADFESLLYIFPENFKLQLPNNIEGIQKAISEFEPSEYGRYDYILNNFSDTIKYKSVYNYLTYQDVVLRTNSLDYIYYCITTFDKFNFNVESKFLGSFSINLFHTCATFESSEYKIGLFQKLANLKEQDSVSLVEYLELKRQDLIDSGEPLDIFDERVLENIKKEKRGK